MVPHQIALVSKSAASTCRQAGRPVLDIGATRTAPWDKVPGFSCAIGESVLKYRGWGARYEHSRLVDQRNGFTAWYDAGGEVVGVLSLNADDDYRLADELVRSHTPISV